MFRASGGLFSLSLSLGNPGYLVPSVVCSVVVAFAAPPVSTWNTVFLADGPNQLFPICSLTACSRPWEDKPAVDGILNVFHTAGPLIVMIGEVVCGGRIGWRKNKKRETGGKREVPECCTSSIEHVRAASVTCSRLLIRRNTYSFALHQYY